jgi:hypothetical protein
LQEAGVEPLLRAVIHQAAIVPTLESQAICIDAERPLTDGSG